jgi:hypothetical protein
MHAVMDQNIQLILQLCNARFQHNRMLRALTQSAQTQFLYRSDGTLPLTSHLHVHEEASGFRNFVTVRILCWYTAKWASFSNISK